ncbi:upstream stimulatory factor 2 isoform X1 [Trichogramma pretiosum]|uniref:upstream stimulatory factor 2 isoform X1 n=1 Tax=Trichogramma pretiosum TaxID=7493 RepID=UPI0006C95F05|nr:upstream stimulatory factor 2 isoform X1 [Trichogramma pretiosum]
MTSAQSPVTNSREKRPRNSNAQLQPQNLEEDELIITADHPSIMDMLEQHLESPESSSNGPIIKSDNSIVIEEAEIVDCDGDAVVDDDCQYEQSMTYRVVQVNGGASQDIDLPVTQAPLQVLTTPINGQFYVIGNANDVYTTAQTSRSVLAPRAAATLQIEQPPTSLKKTKRDDKRRATHNMVERRRRDKINNWISELGKIIPECSSSNGSGSGGEGSGKANYETQSKGGILAKACEYITELKTSQQEMVKCSHENEKLRQEVIALKQLVTQLRRENLSLKSQLPISHGSPDSILP